jgi:hypothetical protein
MTCLDSGCERTLRLTQPLSISTNQLMTRRSVTCYPARSNSMEEADIRHGQEYKNSLPFP